MSFSLRIIIFLTIAGWFFFISFTPALAADWPKFHGANHNPGISAESLAQPLQAVWSYQADNAINFSAPAVVSNILYIGDEGGKLYAIDTGNGTLSWNVTSPGAVRNTVAVDGSALYYGDNSGNFYARNISNGSQIWSYAGTAPTAVSPVVDGTRVFFGDADGILIALNKSNGSVAWARAPGGAFGYHALSLDEAGTYLSVADKTGRLYTYQASNGTLVCTFTAPSPDTFDRSSPVRIGDRIFIGSNGGNIYAINATNCTQQASFSLGSDVIGTVAYEATSTKLYAGTLAGNVYRLHFNTGTNAFSQDWQTSLGFAINGSPIVSTGGSIPYVFIGADDLYVLNANTGALLSTSATARIDSSFAISNGKGFVGDINGRIYGYTGNPAGDAEGVAMRFLPQVLIDSPKAGDLFSQSIDIKYIATDENDIAGPERFGLGSDAVYIYYSEDGGGTWKEIVRFLPPVGSYRWDAAELQEGREYLIRVLARDRGGEQNDAIAGPIKIDRTPPFFDVDSDPPFAKSNEEVAITIKANEQLREAPSVVVRQKNRLGVRVTLEQISTTTWSGLYLVAARADGTAEILVEGADRAGNIGNLIRKGGIFNVDTTPPPTPIISRPFDNEVVDTLTVSIFGMAEPETKALIFLNGMKVSEVFSDAEGNVVVADIQLSKTFQKGFNFFQVFNEDAVGNRSEPATLTLKYNIPPVVEILTFNGAPLLQTTTTFEGVIGIEGKAFDENEDLLLTSFEVSSDKGLTWQEIATDLSHPRYAWDTRTFSDGEYILRMSATDGYAMATATSLRFFVENFIPVVSFEDHRTVTNASAVVLSGLAESFLRPQTAGIVSVAYSLDGESWISAQPKDGAFDSKREEFDIALSEVQEGFYRVLARATDNRGFVGTGSTILIVDIGPPPAPTVTSPMERTAFGYKEDLREDVAGTQIRIRGVGEPKTTIEARNSLLFFEGTSGSNGVFDIEVTLRDHGENVLRLEARDIAGNRSEETSFVVIHNNPPDIRFLRPRSGIGIGDEFEVVFEVLDRDLDPIGEVNLYYRLQGTQANVLVARNISGNTVSLDSSGIAEGLYEFVLEASDGVSVNSETLEFFIDHTPPTVSAVPLEQTMFSKAFSLEMRGSAADDASGVEYVEYSIDLENWFTAIITSGFRTRKATFRVTHPFELEDGTYDISFRATDVARNVSSASSPQQILVDTTPPRIGSYTLSVRPFILVPVGSGFKMPVGTDAKFVISLEQDTASATLGGFGEQVDLVKEGGLWEAEVTFSEVGQFDLLLSAKDPLGNTTGETRVGAIGVGEKGRVVSGEGEVIEGATITVLVFHPEEQTWRRWQAEAYDQVNPQVSDANGEYHLLFPGGKYQMTLYKDGFQRLRSSSFEFINPHFITTDFVLEPRRGLRGFLESLIEKLGFGE